MHNASVEQLQAQYEDCPDDAKHLGAMLDSLSGRQGQRASELRGKLITRLSGLQATAPELGNQPLRIGALMRLPGDPGLPPPWSEPAGERYELNLPSDASRARTYLAAFDALINELKSSRRRRSRLLKHGQKQPSSAGSLMVYAFEVKDTNGLADDAQVQLEVGSERLDAVVASLLPGGVILSVSKDLGRQIPQAKLLLDDTALLKQLCERIADIGEGRFSFNMAMADAAVDKHATLPAIEAIAASPSKAQLDRSQLRARDCVRTQPLTYIWGPPGCGKTYTLCEIVRTAFVAGKRTLICSNTNKAVDQVLHGVCRQLQQDHPAALDAGQAIRLGNIVDDRLNAEFSELIGEKAVADRLTAQYQARIGELSATQRDVATKLAAARRLQLLFVELDDKDRQLAMLRSETDRAVAECDRLMFARKAGEQALVVLRAEQQRAKGWLRLLERPADAVEVDLAAAEDGYSAAIDELSAARARYQTLHRLKQPLDLEREAIAEQLGQIDRARQKQTIERLQDQERALTDEIIAIQKKIAHIHSEVVRNARVIGTTGTRAYLSVRDISSVDLVIIDEASMLMLPVVWFIAGMSAGRVVICGDFRQLPPIAPTRNSAIAEIIGVDVFDAAGVSQLDPRDQRVVMLDTQRRMQPAICELISGPMYAGRLKTFADRAFWAQRNAEPKPPPPFTATLTIVDSSALQPIESIDESYSRFNTLHALLTRNIAWLLRQSGYLSDAKDLAIVTPYAAQMKLTRNLLADMQLDVQVGTVHAFQGDERSTIVVDITESEGAASQPGRFVRGIPPADTSARLINVAVSRARNHLVIVANLSYLDRVLPSQALLRSVLCRMQADGAVVSARDLLAAGPIDQELGGLEEVDVKALARQYGLFDQQDFDAALAADIGRARESIAIFSGFVAKQRTLELVDALQARIVSGVRARCVTRPPHGNLPNVAGGKAALDKLEEIGCVVDCRKRIHEKVVIIDGRIVWHGSLNALSYSQYSDELMTRTLGQGFAQVMAASLARVPTPFDEVLDAITRAENPRCGKCGDAVRTYIDRGRDGEFFRCEENCSWRAQISAPPRRDNALPRPRSTATAPATTTNEAPPCPACGSETLLRPGRYGQFYGCSKYPKCRGSLRAPTSS